MTAQLVNGSTVAWPGRLMILQGNGEGDITARSNDGHTQPQHHPITQRSTPPHYSTTLPSLLESHPHVLSLLFCVLPRSVWASGDLGASWQLIAGRSGATAAAGGRANSSFYPILSRPATGIDHRYFIYRIGGVDTAGVKHTSTFMSYDGGQSWIDQSSRPGATRFTPGRDRSVLVVDETDALYLIGGWAAQMTPTVWRSPNQGFTWDRLPDTPWPGRGTAVALSHRSRALNRDVLTYLTGWDEVRLYNDGHTKTHTPHYTTLLSLSSHPPLLSPLYCPVWVTSDSARTWMRINSTAPFFPRDSANGEITRDGVIVLVGGQSNQNGTEIALNDGHHRTTTTLPHLTLLTTLAFPRASLLILGATASLFLFFFFSLGVDGW